MLLEAKNPSHSIFFQANERKKHDSSPKLSKFIKYVLKNNPFERLGELEGRRQKQWKIVILPDLIPFEETHEQNKYKNFNYIAKPEYASTFNLTTGT